MVEIVTMPVLLGAPERRLKYVLPEDPLDPFKVTSVMPAGGMISIVSLSETPAKKAVPLKIITLSDWKCTPYSEESREESVCERALFIEDNVSAIALFNTWFSLDFANSGTTTEISKTITANEIRSSTIVNPLL